MTLSASTTTIGSVTTTPPVVAPAAVPTKTSSNTTSSFSTTSSVSSASTASSSSPRVVVDPSSGTLITEYLGAAGSVQSQVPSSAALAYLRAGLTADGFSRTPPFVSLNKNSSETVSGHTTA